MFIFKNSHGEIRAGWSILAIFAFMFAITALASIIAISFAVISGSFELISNMLFKLIILSIINFIVSGVAIFFLWLFYKKPFYAVGLAKKNWIKELCIGLILGIISISLVYLILILTNNIQYIGLNTSYLFSKQMVVALLLFISVGVYEEILFRSYTMTALKTTRNKYVIVILSAVIFSAMHGANPGISIMAFLNIVLIGLLFAYMFIKTGKVWIPMGYHITWNFFMGPIYGFKVSGLEGQESLVQINQNGSDFITGGAFGPEGGVVVTFVILLGFLFACFILKQNMDENTWKIDDNVIMVEN